MSTTQAEGVTTVTTAEERFYGKETPAASEPATPAKPAESEPAKPSEAKPAETAPESEPGETTEEPKPQQLTAEERSKRDQRNNDRKWTRLNRELGEARAEIRRLQEEHAARPAKQPEPAPGHTEGEPQLEDFETVEQFKAAFKAYHVREARNAAERERRQSEQQRTTQTARQTWESKTAKYMKANADSDFAEAFAHVSTAVDASAVSEVVTAAVLESDYGPQIIAHLADHDDELAALVKASKYGAGKIIAKLEDSFANPKAPPPNTSHAPKPPSTVSGNGSTGTRLSREEKFYGKE